MSGDVSTKAGGIGATEASDAKQAEFDFGPGGVPWYLLLFYLSFLVFFTWYTLEYHLPAFLDNGPGTQTENAPSLEGE